MGVYCFFWVMEVSVIAYNYHAHGNLFLAAKAVITATRSSVPKYENEFSW